MKRRKIYLIIIFFLVLSVSIGYAVSTWNMQTLSIHSDVSLVGGDWNIKISNKDIEYDNITNVEVSKSSNTLTKTKYSFDLKLKDINDKYIIDLDIENNGKLDGEIDNVKLFINDNLIRNVDENGVINNSYLENKYLSYQLKYWDGVDLFHGDLLKVLNKDSLKLEIDYLFDESVDYAMIDKDLTISFEINFRAKTNTAKERKHNLKSIVKLGDYLSLNSFNENSENSVITLSKNKTGLDENYEMNLDNFNKWRVINIDNDNNKIELISEYVSNNVYKLKGTTGFINYVYILNDISSNYLLDNTNIKAARLFGFNGQKEVLDDLNDEANNDELYQTDYALITTSIESLIANKIDNTTSLYGTSSRYKENDTYGIKYINNSGLLENMVLKDEEEHEIEANYRVIITIDSDINVKNDGSSATPFLLD